MYIYIHTCIYIYIQTHIYIYIHISKYLSVVTISNECAGVSASEALLLPGRIKVAYMHIYVWMYTQTYVYKYIHIHVYIHTYMYEYRYMYEYLNMYSYLQICIQICFRGLITSWLDKSSLYICMDVYTNICI
jgi:hypothetical protein